MTGRAYQPPDGQPTAGQLRRATARAFDRHLDDEYTAQAHAQVTGVVGAADSLDPLTPEQILADELTRRPVPNRAQRRAQIHAQARARRARRAR